MSKSYLISAYVAKIYFFYKIMRGPEFVTYIIGRVVTTYDPPPIIIHYLIFTRPIK